MHRTVVPLYLPIDLLLHMLALTLMLFNVRIVLGDKMVVVAEYVLSTSQ